MRLLEAHRRAIGEFDNRVRKIQSHQWDNPTPCTDWSVRDLVNHLVAEQRWAPWLLDGATLADVGDQFDGDILGEDPVSTWREASTLARDAWTAPQAASGEVYVTGGMIPAEEYGWQMTLDLTIHAWDLARGIGTEEALDPDLVEATYAVVAPQVPSLQGIGIFAPPQPVAEDAADQAKMLGLLGRRP